MCGVLTGFTVRFKALQKPPLSFIQPSSSLIRYRCSRKIRLFHLDELAKASEWMEQQGRIHHERLGPEDEKCSVEEMLRHAQSAFFLLIREKDIVFLFLLNLELITMWTNMYTTHNVYTFRTCHTAILFGPSILLSLVHSVSCPSPK